MTVKYFAYGSNMSLPRLRARTPSAKRIGMYTLVKYLLRFHKVCEKDGSAKCDALFTGNHDHYVNGALFDIADDEKVILDEVEGLGVGYQDKIVSVHDMRGNRVEAVTYYATHTDPRLQPYSWYLQHVIYGAEQTGVPADYLAAIRATNSIEDPHKERDARERAIYD